MSDTAACAHLNSLVINSRTVDGEIAPKRRRKCIDCGYRFTTQEYSYEKIEEMRDTINNFIRFKKIFNNLYWQMEEFNMEEFNILDID